MSNLYVNEITIKAYETLEKSGLLPVINSNDIRLFLLAFYIGHEVAASDYTKSYFDPEKAVDDFMKYQQDKIRNSFL